MPAGVHLFLLWSAFAAELSTGPTEPLPIVGGDEALTCEFPSVVALVNADEHLRCSATLVHPEVVVTAAHCLVDKKTPVVRIAFGEAVDFEMQVSGGMPERVIPVANCEAHPGYVQRGTPDVAYCTLSEPVLDVPRIPLLAGCEIDTLQPGVEVTIAGFGATFGQLVEGPDGPKGEPELVTEGTGPKRYTTQTIDVMDLDSGLAAVVGSNGSQSGCFGDSGGPAMIEMADGTWRVFGAGSTLYTPENELPPPEIPGNICGTGTAYALLSLQLEWLETQSGFDLTPCHDDAGNWSPQEGCGDFPVSPDVASGSWADGCAGGPIGGGEPQCEDVAGTSGGTTGERHTCEGSAGPPALARLIRPRTVPLRRRKERLLESTAAVDADVAHGVGESAGLNRLVHRH